MVIGLNPFNLGLALVVSEVLTLEIVAPGTGAGGGGGGGSSIFGALKHISGLLLFHVDICQEVNHVLDSSLIIDLVHR
jgi:hypothetical protein